MGNEEERKSAISMGNFDGCHLGHLKIINTLKKISMQTSLNSVVLTFVPSPRVYFDREMGLINTDDQKKRILEVMNVDRIFYLNFAKISNLSGNDFVKKYLIQKFDMKYLVVGENFKFGKNRDSDVGFLKSLAKKYDFKLRIIKPEVLDGVRISSSYIREKLAKGEIGEANRMLGKRYCIEGIISEGDKIGRELGFPTINIHTNNSILPEGVFKTSVEVDHDIFDSITNIGYRPTFLGREIKVETHILNFDRIIYGKKVGIYFERKIRNEVKFDSKNKLIRQIKEDIESVKVDKKALF